MDALDSERSEWMDAVDSERSACTQSSTLRLLMSSIDARYHPASRLMSQYHSLFISLLLLGLTANSLSIWLS